MIARARFCVIAAFLFWGPISLFLAVSDATTGVWWMLADVNNPPTRVCTGPNASNVTIPTAECVRAANGVQNVLECVIPLDVCPDTPDHLGRLCGGQVPSEQVPGGIPMTFSPLLEGSLSLGGGGLASASSSPGVSHGASTECVTPDLTSGLGRVPRFGLRTRPGTRGKPPSAQYAGRSTLQMWKHVHAHAHIPAWQYPLRALCRCYEYMYVLCSSTTLFTTLVERRDATPAVSAFTVLRHAVRGIQKCPSVLKQYMVIISSVLAVATLYGLNLAWARRRFRAPPPPSTTSTATRRITRLRGGGRTHHEPPTFSNLPPTGIAHGTMNGEGASSLGTYSLNGSTVMESVPYSTHSRTESMLRNEELVHNDPDLDDWPKDWDDDTPLVDRLQDTDLHREYIHTRKRHLDGSMVVHCLTFFKCTAGCGELQPASKLYDIFPCKIYHHDLERSCSVQHALCTICVQWYSPHSKQVGGCPRCNAYECPSCSYPHTRPCPHDCWCQGQVCGGLGCDLF